MKVMDADFSAYAEELLRKYYKLKDIKLH